MVHINQYHILTIVITSKYYVVSATVCAVLLYDWQGSRFVCTSVSMVMTSTKMLTAALLGAIVWIKCPPKVVETLRAVT
jgi:hypothetical protein